MVIYLLLTLVGGVIMKTAIADVLAQDLELAYITDADPPGLGLYTTITVAGQPMNVVVDTSSIRLLYVWQDAYEKARGVGACKRMFYHCYSCGRHQCKPQDTSNVTLGDGTSALIFRWADDMRVGGRNFMLMKFGLIFASEPTFAERTPHGVLGLGNDAGQYYPTIMDQLGVRIPYSKNMFTLYLRHSFGGNVPARGDLLIGGADKSAYVPPLRLVPALSMSPWTVRLTSLALAVGTEIAIGKPVVLNTGCNWIEVPQASMVPLIKAIQKEASRKAGREVVITYLDVYKIYTFDSNLRGYMPTLNFMLSSPDGDAPLSLDIYTYIAETPYYCYLLINSSATGNWVLPNFMLVGRYMEFRVDERRVGFAEVSK